MQRMYVIIVRENMRNIAVAYDAFSGEELARQESDETYTIFLAKMIKAFHDMKWDIEHIINDGQLYILVK
jgi:hypothetical protein